MNNPVRLRLLSWKGLGISRWKTSRLNLVILLLACALSFGLRYYYVFGYINVDAEFQQIGGDPEDYLRIAYTLSQTENFAEPTNINVKESLLHHQHPSMVSSADIQRTAWRPPLWPFVLAVMMKVTNYDLRSMLYLRFIFDLLTLFLFYRLLLHLHLHWLSRTAALLLFAVHPAWLIYSGTFFSEPLTLLVHIAFSLSVFALLRNGQSLFRAGVVGALAGLTILEHPFYLFFPLLVTGFIYAAKLIKVRSVLLILTVMVITVTPWALRNMLLYHTTKPILTTSAGINLVKGWNPAFLTLYRNTTADVVISTDVIDGKKVEKSNLNEEEKSDAYARLAINFAEANWRLVPAIITRKLIGAITPFPETSRTGVLEIGRIVFQVISFMPLFFILASQRAGRFRLLSASLLLAYLLMSMLTLGTIRYRFPLIWVELLSVVLVIDFSARRLFDEPSNVRSRGWLHSSKPTRSEAPEAV